MTPTSAPPAPARAPSFVERAWGTRQARLEDGLAAILTLVGLSLPTLMLLAAVNLQDWPLLLVETAAIGVAIWLRRRWSVLGLVVLLALAAVHVAVHAPMYPVWFGVLVVLYSAGRFELWPGKLAALGVSLAASLLASWWFFTLPGLGNDKADPWVQVPIFAIPPMLLFSLMLLVGWGVRAVARGDQATERAVTAVQRADEQAERAALARDMHDVVAHSLAVVIAQANGARYTPDPAAKDATLETIASTAKQALGDVRLLLAQLRHQEAPDPIASLEGIDALVERMRGSGLDVRLERYGEPHLARTADIAAYRILQEALTNALRHGDREGPVHVRIVGDREVVLDVHNRMRAAPGDAGHGVRGIHERARLAGGHAWTGVEDGWFRVRAAFPSQGGPR